MATIGEAIRAMRQARNLTLADLAELAGTDKGYLSRVERGHREPSKRWVKSIAEALSADLERHRGAA